MTLRINLWFKFIAINVKMPLSFFFCCFMIAMRTMWKKINVMLNRICNMRDEIEHATILLMLTKNRIYVTSNGHILFTLFVTRGKHRGRQFLFNRDSICILCIHSECIHGDLLAHRHETTASSLWCSRKSRNNDDQQIGMVAPLRLRTCTCTCVCVYLARIWFHFVISSLSVSSLVFEMITL